MRNELPVIECVGGMEKATLLRRLGGAGIWSFGGVWSFGGDSLIRIDVELSKRRFDGDDVIQQDAGAGVDFMAEG